MLISYNSETNILKTLYKSKPKPKYTKFLVESPYTLWKEGGPHEGEVCNEVCRNRTFTVHSVAI
jgi:hypothetical protein